MQPVNGSIVRACTACGRSNRIPLAHVADRGRCGACKAELAPLDEPLDVDEPSFETIVDAAEVPVLVDFWAPWCGPCRSAAPMLEALGKSRAGKLLVLKVNTDEQPELAG